MINFLGKRIDSDEVVGLFTTYNCYKRPEIDPDDDIYTDWVLLRRYGFELGFSDSFYVDGEKRSLWGKGELVLSQIYFYKADEDINGYSEELPFSIEWSDDFTSLNEKLANALHLRRGVDSDSWVFEEYTLNVLYENDSIDKVAILLNMKAIKSEERYLKNNTLLADTVLAFDFDKVISMTVLDQTLPKDDLDVGWQEDEIDLRYSDGISIRFFTGQKTICQSVTYFNDRSYLSVKYLGEIPFGLDFNMGLKEVLSKIPDAPDEIYTDGAESFIRWYALNDMRVNIQYSNIYNSISRISVGLFRIE